MEHDRWSKGVAGHRQRRRVWRRGMAFLAVLFMAAIGYAVAIVALVHHAPLR